MTRRGSKILDRGTELLTIYPIKVELNRVGNEVHVPNYATPVTRWVNATTDRQSFAEVPGHVDVKVLKISTRALPAATNSLAIFRGEEWDVAIPPTTSQVGRATEHIAITLRSRNKRVAT